jgi:hypothetical protein
MKNSRKKQSTRRFVISLADGLVMPGQGFDDRNGYRFRLGLYGGYFEDLKFI